MNQVWAKTPGSSFHEESSGGIFGQSCLIMSGPNANRKALVRNF